MCLLHLAEYVAEIFNILASRSKFITLYRPAATWNRIIFQDVLPPETISNYVVLVHICFAMLCYNLLYFGDHCELRWHSSAQYKSNRSGKASDANFSCVSILSFHLLLFRQSWPWTEVPVAILGTKIKVLCVVIWVLCVSVYSVLVLTFTRLTNTINSI